MARGKPHKSAAESPHLATLSPSIVVLHGLLHPHSACLTSVPKLVAAEAEMDHKLQKKTGSSRVVNLPLPPFSQLHSHFYLLSVFAFVHAQHASTVIEEGAAESHAHGPCILYRRGDSPTSFSIPTSWQISLRSINQIPRSAELKKRNKAFVEMGEKRGVCTESVQDLESFLLIAVIRVWGGHLLWCMLSTFDK